MPRRSILTDSERDSLLALPDNQEDLIRHFAFSESDLSIIRQHRGTANRVGFAIQLCYMRYPGMILGVNEIPSPVLLCFVAEQLKESTDRWNDYGQRFQTRREHLVELQSLYNFKPFATEHYKPAVLSLDELAWKLIKASCWQQLLSSHFVAN